MDLPKIRIEEIKVCFLPRKPLCEKQCPLCPFRPDGGILNQPDARVTGDMAKIRYSASVGDFYCHDTVYVDKTVPEPVRRPESEWRVCRGAYEFRKADQVRKMIAYYRSTGQLVEAEPVAP